jgi:hypothetical protein
MPNPWDEEEEEEFKQHWNVLTNFNKTPQYKI